MVVVVILSGIDYQHKNSSGRRSKQKTVPVEHHGLDVENMK
jgi:hypothetical protein